MVEDEFISDLIEEDIDPLNNSSGNLEVPDLFDDELAPVSPEKPRNLMKIRVVGKFKAVEGIV